MNQVVVVGGGFLDQLEPFKNQKDTVQLKLKFVEESSLKLHSADPVKVCLSIMLSFSCRFN